MDKKKVFIPMSIAAIVAAVGIGYYTGHSTAVSDQAQMPAQAEVREYAAPQNEQREAAGIMLTSAENELTPATGEPEATEETEPEETPVPITETPAPADEEPERPEATEEELNALFEQVFQYCHTPIEGIPAYEAGLDVWTEFEAGQISGYLESNRGDLDYVLPSGYISLYRAWRSGITAKFNYLFELNYRDTHSIYSEYTYSEDKWISAETGHIETLYKKYTTGTLALLYKDELPTSLTRDYKDLYKAWRVGYLASLEAVEEVVEEAPVETPSPAPVKEVEYTYTSVNETVYATGAANIRTIPTSNNNSPVGQTQVGASYTRIGIGTGAATGYSLLEINGQQLWVYSEYLIKNPPSNSSGGSASGGSTSGGSTSDGSTSGGSSQSTGDFSSLPSDVREFIAEVFSGKSYDELFSKATRFGFSSVEDYIRYLMQCQEENAEVLAEDPGGVNDGSDTFDPSRYEGVIFG